MSWSSLSIVAQVYFIGFAAVVTLSLGWLAVIWMDTCRIRAVRMDDSLMPARLFMGSWAWPLLVLVGLALAIWKFAQFIVEAADIPALWKEEK